MNELVEYIDEVCGLYFRSILLPVSGIKIPTHKHPYSHATVIGSGKVRLYVDGEVYGIYVAGQIIELKANKEHLWESMEPNTRLFCVHDTRSAEFIKKAGL
jgi:quercetin dioxygenase-like cupin family protein